MCEKVTDRVLAGGGGGGGGEREILSIIINAFYLSLLMHFKYS